MKIIKTNINKISSNSVQITNYKGVLSFICDEFKKSIRLSTYLKEELTELFGQYNTTYNSEFNYFIWIIEFKNEIFEIYTADGKGTMFCIVDNEELNYSDIQPDNKSKICIEFLKEFDKLLQQ